MAQSSTVRVLHERGTPEALPVGTVTFLLADIEGSLRLWEKDPKAMGLAIQRMHLLVDAVVAQHDGVRPVEQGEGDSFVVAFEHADDAVACALGLQLALAREPWPGALDLRTRMALHTGKAELRDEGNYVGSAISRCGRLRSLAHGGQTIVSATTYELVSDALPEGVKARDLGLHEIRGVDRPLRIYQLDHAELDRTFPPLRSLEVLTGNLPPQLTSFVGREAELRDVEALLATNASRLVTPTGPGGCGKTRLALRVAERIAENYPDGIWFADLSSVRDDALVADAVAEATGRAAGATLSALEKVREHLRPRRALVILDNCEQVVEGAASLVDDLLRHCTGLTILATSREPLRVEGEAQWRVPSMSAPGTGDTGAVAALEAYDAVRLFIERAVKARANFAVTNETAPAVAQICQQLDGLPLAIELAAARVRLLSPDAIAQGLSDRFRLLHGGARSTGARQQTLEASVDWSYDLLDEGERTLLRRLHVFRGGFTLTAAEEACTGEGLAGIDRLDVLDLLAALVDKSLVVSGNADSGPDWRYRLLETIRMYAFDRARDAGEDEALGRRHAEVFAAFARSAMYEVIGADQLEWLAKVDAEHDNLRAALDWAVRNEDGRIGLSIVASMGNFWNVRGHWQEALRWIDKL
ncbi:MAG: ATP-binding protein, partial [Acidimicrobiia bacterium]